MEYSLLQRATGCVRPDDLIVWTREKREAEDEKRPSEIVSEGLLVAERTFCQDSHR